MPKKPPPSKIEAKVDEVMHKIDQELDKLVGLNGKGAKRVREKISKKHTRLAMAAYNDPWDSDPEHEAVDLDED